MNEWITVERPGYFGDKRDEIKAQWNDVYGSDAWRLRWEFSGALLSQVDYLELVYTIAYFEYFRIHPEISEWISTFKDIWDTAESNVNSGLDFRIQETPNNHFHDVAVRRAMAMVGFCFKGDRLLHIRWKDSAGYRLNPGVVPFHRPDLIVPGNIQNLSGKNQWWYPGTIEDQYQKSKLLQVRISGPGGI